MFEHVEPFAGDPILALVEVFNADARAHKVNLGIGIYFDVYLMGVVILKVPEIKMLTSAVSRRLKK